MTEIVDLRSDTVTRPSPAMRAAIAAAEVGDDVLGDDPTVNRLQERMAAFLGQEAALFVPSGSMANQVAIRSVCEPGDEIIADETTHSYNFEGGGPAALSGEGLHGALVARVHVGPLVAVHLHAHEVRVEVRGQRRVLVRLAVHHVAPVAPHRADVEEDGPVRRARRREGLLRPFLPECLQQLGFVHLYGIIVTECKR